MFRGLYPRPMTTFMTKTHTFAANRFRTSACTLSLGMLDAAAAFGVAVIVKDSRPVLPT